MNTKTSVKIHPTAIVAEGAEFAEGVEIGPYAIIGPHVQLGVNTKVGPHVNIDWWTRIGKNCEIFTGAVIGSITQDKKFKGGKSYIRIGDNNNIREYVTINPGTEEGTATVLGNNNLLMAYSHVAHDCALGNNITLANAGTLAGHVTIGDRAIVGGLSAVHQFVRIGTLAIIGGCSKVVQDVPPFMISDGHPSKSMGINSVGLDRANYSKEDKQELKRAYKFIYRSGLTVKNAIKKIQQELTQTPSIQALLAFLESTERGIS